MMRTPSSNSAGSPRSLLIRKPAISARSAASSTVPVPHHRRDDAAAVDVPDQADRHLRPACKSHVGDIPGAQIDLCRAAGALHDHQIELVDQPREALHDRVHQAGAPRPVVRRVQHPHRPPVHDHLRAPVGLRLQQHRIEVRPRRQAGRARLHRLRPPDLAPVRAGRGVVRHVLRLEGRHAHAPPLRRPAQPGDHHRLPRVRRRPLDHHRPRTHAHSFPIRLAQPATTTDAGKDSPGTVRRPTTLTRSVSCSIFRGIAKIVLSATLRIDLRSVTIVTD